jgi:hypothetical protein
MSGGKKFLILAVAAVVLVYYSWLMRRYLCDVAGGSDSSGYVNFAWRLSHGPLVEPIKAIDTFDLSDDFLPVFQPLGFTWGPKGIVSRANVPLYPPGLPIHMAFLAGFLGWKLGPFLVSPLAALACLLLMYGLSRKFGLSPPWSLAGAAVLAAFPVFLFQAVQPMSDVLAVAWGMLAVFAGLQSRKRAGWAWLAGAAVGINVLVRPTNILILFPLAFALPAKPKIYLRLVLGGLPFAAVMGALNLVLYGNPLTDGYRGEQLTSVVFSLFGKNAVQFGAWFLAMMTFVFPLAWLLLPANRSVPRRDRWLLVFWFAPFFLLYSLFDFVTMWTHVRYLLPGVPALVLAGMLWLRDGTEFVTRKIRSAGRPERRRPAWLVRAPAVVAGVICVLILLAEVREIKRLHVLDVHNFEATYKISCLAVKEALLEKSVVLSGQLSGALTYYTKTVPCMFNALKPGQFEVLRQKALLRGYSLYALLFPVEEAELQKYAPGPWTKIANYKFVTLWTIQSP